MRLLLSNDPEEEEGEETNRYSHQEANEEEEVTVSEERVTFAMASNQHPPSLSLRLPLPRLQGAFDEHCNAHGEEPNESSAYKDDTM